MTQSMRFGRRLALPSTLQIRQELTILMREEARRAGLEKDKAEPSIPAVVPDLPVIPH